MASDKTRPTFTLILGPPGAGKSVTSAKDPDTPFFDRDKVLQKLSGGEQKNFHKTALREAERLRLLFVDTHLKDRTNYGLQGHLTTPAALNVTNEPRQQGFKIRVDFICAGTLEEHLKRAKGREKQRGHIVPPDELSKMYALELRNLPRLFEKTAEGDIDILNVYDNTKKNTEARLLITIRNNTVAVTDKHIPEWTHEALAHSPYTVERLQQAQQQNLSLSQLDQHRQSRIAALAIPLTLPKDIKSNDISLYRTNETILDDLNYTRAKLVRGDPPQTIIKDFQTFRKQINDSPTRYAMELIRMVETQIGPTQHFREWIDVRQSHGSSGDDADVVSRTSGAPVLLKR